MLRGLIACTLVACGTTSPTERPKDFGGDRPVTLHVPANFDASKSYPLVVVLHGYGASGFVQAAFFGVSQLPDAYVLAPDGNVDSTGKEFWNADPACCDFDHKNPDDVGYIGGLIDDVKAAWPVSTVYVLGHSNGGYMAYRMACERADVIDNIVVLAGVQTTLPCHPAKPVELLHMHGTADDMVPYAQAKPSVDAWAQLDGCTTTYTAQAPMDLDASVDGAETMPQAAACPPGIDVEFWTLTGSGHIPSPSPEFEPSIWHWLTSHPRDI